MSDKQTELSLDYLNTLFSNKTHEEYIKIGLMHRDSRAFTYKYFLNIKDIINYIDTAKYIYDIYVGLSTYTAERGEEDYLHTRYAIGFDFDKKDGIESYKDVVDIFKKYNLFYHLMVDSGGGYHIYLFIEPTAETERVNELNKYLGELLGSDSKALSSTQILRIPGTYNYKGYEETKKQKPVNIIYKANRIRLYTLKELEDRFYKFKKVKKERLIGQLNESNLTCINNMLSGVEKGQRNFCLGRLVQFFKQKGTQKDRAKTLIEEWNERCNPPKSDNELMGEFETFWNDKYVGMLSCNFKTNERFQEILLNYCDKGECKRTDKFDVYNLGEEVIEYKNKIMQNKDVEGNELIIIGILEIFKEGLLMSDIQKKLISAATGKPYMSRPTLSNVLTELIQKKFILCTEGKTNTKNFYKVNEKIWNKTGFTPINYGTIRRTIELDISPTAFRVLTYIYYRKRNHELHKDRQYISYDDIAYGINIDNRNVNKYLKILEDNEFIKIERYYNEITTMWYNNIILLP